LSAKHQQNITETSADPSRISELSAEYQENMGQSALAPVNMSAASANYQMRAVIGTSAAALE